MRISTTQIFQSGINQIQAGQGELSRTSLQLGSGKRILSPSDDPSGTTQINQFERIIKATKQFQRNMDNTQPRMQQQESLLQQGTDSLQRARELVVTGNNDSQTRETRGYLADELRQIRDGLLDMANTKDPNGEYIFAGTKSQNQPFRQDGEGNIRYEGASGAGSVREVAVSADRKIAVGHDGAAVFMDIPENDGRVGAGVVQNNGSMVLEKTGVTSVSELDDREYTIAFDENEDGDLVYTITYVNDDGDVVSLEEDAEGDPVQYPYVPRESIEFAGRSVTISGTPEPGDAVVSRPAENASVFETLDRIIDALERSGDSASARADLASATNTALANLDAILGNFSDQRADLGGKLKAFDQQKELNEDRLLDLESAVSQIRDLDYAEAISRFNQQQVALQAAQQTYTQVNRLSLFDFI
ncbi:MULTISPECIES: flagellar hook-associated protein FlgL [unclassified Thioalkalivibrio]|uniref:flagellar hook-associated protein FlgL n=1 Tax=unclassified Thioalkalivibrio TaxID=2621013 RepID=UPI00035F98E4|nr:MULTISPECIES: flagellar hook-associated protein FlgL [unclassified Thioalkalivibrio]